MQRRAFSFKVKQLDNADPVGSFEGMLAVYGNVDLGGDAIVPGAFTRTLQNHGNQVPLLWQHKPDDPIGTLQLSDTPTGLAAKGQLELDLPTARVAYTLLKAKVIKGLSIGYDTITDSIDDGVRYLKELRLWEGSLVTFPMNEQATVSAVKTISAEDDREILAAIRRLTEKAHRIAEE